MNMIKNLQIFLNYMYMDVTVWFIFQIFPKCLFDKKITQCEFFFVLFFFFFFFLVSFFLFLWVGMNGIQEHQKIKHPNVVLLVFVWTPLRPIQVPCLMILHASWNWDWYSYSARDWGLGAFKKLNIVLLCTRHHSPIPAVYLVLCLITLKYRCELSLISLEFAGWDVRWIGSIKKLSFVAGSLLISLWCTLGALSQDTLANCYLTLSFLEVSFKIIVWT